MKNKIASPKIIQPAIGAVLATLCGLLLWQSIPAPLWVNASYDNLFRFGTRPVTNNVVLVLMDSQAFGQFHQTRGQPWDRALHARLLNKLADDGCALVVMDSFFREEQNQAKDDALAAAMKRQRNIVLMAEPVEVTHPGLMGIEPLLPAEKFLAAAKTNWGVAWLELDSDKIVRRHPTPGPYPSLAETAARLSGAKLNSNPGEYWLRYYGEDALPKMSYAYALTKPPNYFRDKIAFIGTEPQTAMPGNEADEFITPFTSWTGRSSGGVEILLTQFLNLMNDESLQRLPFRGEFSILIVSGILIGVGLSWLKFWKAAVLAVIGFVVISFAAVSWSYFTNYWFPWLVIAGGQVPCALVWVAIIEVGRRRGTQPVPVVEKLPETPGYKLFNPPFGKGAYGKVWLARNTKGQWLALKVVYLKNFEGTGEPFEREFKGISRYKTVSGGHPGLLPIGFISEKNNEYFYYTMELGDSLVPDWEREPKKYQPRDLAGERARLPNQRLPVEDCIRIAMALADALEFLHQRGLTHRDIKPQNVIFVNGQPKLADLGLIAEIRPPDENKTFVGTPGYMPPPPEPPGTPQADIYALGMLLYVISTGRNASFFPEIATTLVNASQPVNFLPLNAIILKACHPDITKRYRTVTEMRQALSGLAKS